MTPETPTQTPAQNQIPQPAQAKKPHIVLGLMQSAFVLLGATLGFVAAQFLGGVWLVVTLKSLALPSLDIDQIIDNIWVNIAIYISSAVLLVLVSWLIFMARGKNFWEAIGLKSGPKWSDLKFGITTYLSYVAFSMSIAFVFSLLRDINADQKQDLGINFANQTLTSGLGVFILLVVLTPILEEIVFRGIVYRRIRNWIPKWLAAALVSLTFGALHMEFFKDGPLNFVAAFDTAFLSLFLIFIVQKTNRLWPAIYVHAFKNLTAFLILMAIS